MTNTLSHILSVCCCSCQGADRCCTLLLLDGPSRSGSLHQEEHQDGSDWLQPQVRNRDRHTRDIFRRQYTHIKTLIFVFVTTVCPFTNVRPMKQSRGLKPMSMLNLWVPSRAHYPISRYIFLLITNQKKQIIDCTISNIK